jgi:hypothetical protein
MRRCYTCNKVRPDAEIVLCRRDPCTGQTDVAKDNKAQGTRPPQLNPGEEKPDLYDSWAGIGLVYKLEIDASGNVIYRVEPST